MIWNEAQLNKEKTIPLDWKEIMILVQPIPTSRSKDFLKSIEVYYSNIFNMFKKQTIHNIVI